MIPLVIVLENTNMHLEIRHLGRCLEDPQSKTSSAVGGGHLETTSTIVCCSNNETTHPLPSLPTPLVRNCNVEREQQKIKGRNQTDCLLNLFHVTLADIKPLTT